MLDMIAGRHLVFHSHKQNNPRRQTLKRVRPIAMSTGTYSNTWSNNLDLVCLCARHQKRQPRARSAHFPCARPCADACHEFPLQRVRRDRQRQSTLALA